MKNYKIQLLIDGEIYDTVIKAKNIRDVRVKVETLIYSFIQSSVVQKVTLFQCEKLN